MFLLIQFLSICPTIFLLFVYREEVEGFHHMGIKILSQMAYYFIASYFPPQYELLLAHYPNISSNYLILTPVHYCCSLFPKETRFCSCTEYPSICLPDSFPRPPKTSAGSWPVAMTFDRNI